MSDQVQLSPPWYTLRNEIAAVLNGPNVTVGQLDTSQPKYVVPIAAKNATVGSGVASILPQQYTMGNIVIVPVVTVSGSPVTATVPTSAQQLAGFVQAAFQDNALLQSVVVQPIMPGGPPAVFPVFAAQIVQFPNDDLSDLYHNFNAVLAATARAVLAPAPGGFTINPSTAKIAK